MFQLDTLVNNLVTRHLPFLEYDFDIQSSTYILKTIKIRKKKTIQFYSVSESSGGTACIIQI